MNIPRVRQTSAPKNEWTKTVEARPDGKAKQCGRSIDKERMPQTLANLGIVTCTTRPGRHVPMPAWRFFAKRFFVFIRGNVGREWRRVEEQDISSGDRPERRRKLLDASPWGTVHVQWYLASISV